MHRSTLLGIATTLSVAASLVLVGPAQAGKRVTVQVKNSVATAGDVRAVYGNYPEQATVQLTYTCAPSQKSAVIEVTAGNFANWSPKYGSGNGGGLTATCDGRARTIDLAMRSTAYGWPIEQPGTSVTVTARMLGNKAVLLASHTRSALVVQG
jgi:hypothetical protein